MNVFQEIENINKKLDFLIDFHKQQQKTGEIFSMSNFTPLLDAVANLESTAAKVKNSFSNLKNEIANNASVLAEHAENDTHISKLTNRLHAVFTDLENYISSFNVSNTSIANVVHEVANTVKTDVSVVANTVHNVEANVVHEVTGGTSDVVHSVANTINEAVDSAVTVIKAGEQVIEEHVHAEGPVKIGPLTK